MTKVNVTLVLLAALAIALFVAIGGDGTDLAEHAVWMARVRDSGAAVMW